jgi:hypothetical protein
VSVRLELALHAEGDGGTERSIRENVAAILADPGYRVHPEYHEMVAHLAMMLARIERRTADHLRELERQAERRQARAAARKAAQ